MPDSLQSFVEAVRPLLGDRFGGRTDSELVAVMRVVIQQGLVPAYALTPDRLSVTPSIATPRDWTLLVYNTLLKVVYPDAAANAWGTRAARESFGAAGDFIEHIESQLTAADGSLVAGVTWQDLGGALRGLSGMRDLSERMTRATFDGPWHRVHFAPSGVTTS